MSSMTNNVDRVGEQVKHSASQARSSVIDLVTQALRLVNGLREVEQRGVEAFLSRLGLQRRGGIGQPILWFAAGAVVAGGAALLLAPMKGEDLLRLISDILGNKTHDVVAKHAVDTVASGSGNGGQSTSIG